MFSTRLARLTLLVLLLVACGPTSAAGNVTDSTLAPTAQSDQYRRDAQATQDAREAAIAQNVRNLQATDDAATRTAMLAGTQAALEAERLSDQATEQASAHLTTTALAEHQATLAAEANQAATASAGITAIARANADRTSTAVTNVQATGTQAVVETQTTIALRLQDAEAQRAHVALWVNLILLVLLIIGGLAVLFYFGKAAVDVLRKQGSAVRYGPNGVNALVVLDNGRGQEVINPLTNTAGITRLDGQGGLIANELDPSVRLLAMMAAMRIMLEQATHSPFAPPHGRPAQRDRWAVGPYSHERETGALDAPTSPRAIPARPSPASSPHLPNVALPPEAPWRLLDDWRGGLLPIGLGPRGLLQADPDLHAHLLVAGRTGTGKSRRLLKPLIALALADGWQVVVFDRANLHFRLFGAHPNAHLVTVEDPEALASHVVAIHGEVSQRFKRLAGAGAERWSLEFGPRVLVVVDDYGILSDMLSPTERKLLWLYTRRLIADSRKSGVHLVLVVQSPTWQSFDLGIRRNMTPIAFAVNDSDSSRTILDAPGAESLAQRRFLVKLDVLTPGVAFDPSDEQLAGLLAARPVQQLPAPAFLTEPAPPIPLPAALDDRAARIRALRAQGRSLNEIQDQVFGYRGGSAYAAVKAALADTTTGAGLDTEPVSE